MAVSYERGTPVAPHSGRPTILKSTCSVRGTDASTLERKGARAREIGAPSETALGLGRAVREKDAQMRWDLQRLHDVCDARLANERAGQLHLGHVLAVVQPLNDCLHCIMAAGQGGSVRLHGLETGENGLERIQLSLTGPPAGR